MNNLESFLEKYSGHLDSIVIAGGWAIEIFQDKVQNPRREHHDVDTLVLNENLHVEGDTGNVPGEYVGSIYVESVDWLREYMVEKQVVCDEKTYDVKTLCPEFIVVSKAFSKIGEAREKDNKDIKYIFKTINLDQGKLFSLIEKASLLREGSNFLDIMIEKGLETKNYSRDDFNQKIFQKKFSLEKIPKQISNKNIKSYDLLFSEIEKGLGTGWIKNNQQQVQKIVNNLDAQKAESYGLAIRDSLLYAGKDIKKDLTDKILTLPNTDKVRSYGLAIWNAFEFAEEDIQKDIADKLLGTSDSKKAMNYSFAIKDALEYARKDVQIQQGLINKIFEN